MIAALTLSACSSPARPTAVDPLLGSWIGTVTNDGDGGTGSVRIDLTSRDFAVTGTWEWTFPDGRLNARGSATVVSQTTTTLTLALLPAAPFPCTASAEGALFTATLTRTGDRLSGPWSGLRACGTGHLDLRRSS
jgi:hypothetical protein